MSLLSIVLRSKRWLERSAISTVAFCAAAGVLIGSGLRFGCFSDYKEYIASRVQHIDSTCVPAVGITRSEMQARFPDVKMYVLAEYDKSLKCDVARWMYQVGDSDVFFTFVYSYGSGTIVEWKMQQDYGYYNYYFYDYLKSADMKTEPDL